MAIVATLTSPDGVTFSFDKFLTPAGRVLDFPLIVEEELIANGVDGRRFRTNAYRYPPFPVQTLETYSTYANAVASARYYDSLVGEIVRLTVSNLAGYSYTFERVHVLSCAAVVRPGSVAGAATPSNTAYIVADMEMVVMELIPGLNP